MKKKWQKMLIPFIAILIIFAVLYNSPREGFQSSILAAVGVQFTGPLSVIYNKITSNENVPQHIKLIVKDPISIIPDFLKTHPKLKYSIIQLSTGKVIYDPIAQYEKNKTMDPFPKTTNSDTYIIYSNVFNMPITMEQAKKFYPKVISMNNDPDILPNCSTQDTRTNTEDLIASYKKMNSLMLKNEVAKTRNFNIVNISGNLDTFNSQVSIDPNRKTRPSDIFTYFTQDEQDAANAAGAAASGYTGSRQNFSTITAAQIESYNTAVIAYLKGTVTYADAKEDLDFITLMMQNRRNVRTAVDTDLGSFATIEGITHKTIVYEPCAEMSGLKNIEGFAATNVDDLNLYDYKGNKITPESEGMNGTTIALIVVGVLAVIGGGVYLATRSSNSSNSA